MGNSQGIYNYSVTDPRSVSLPQLDRLEDSTYRRIWKNKSTGQSYQEFTIFVNTSRSLQEQFDIYQRRRQQDASLVSVYFVENISKQYQGTTLRELKVLTQYVPVTLNQIATFPLTSALHFLRKAFVGFSALFREVGYFEVSDIMMGVNEGCEPKVWLNPNWAVNMPTCKNIRSGNLTHLEGLMAKKIFEEVERHMKPEELDKYLPEKNKIEQWTFQLAGVFVDCFVKIEGLILPQKVSYVRKFSDKQSYSMIIQEPHKEKQAPEKLLQHFLKIDLLESIEEDPMITQRQCMTNTNVIYHEPGHYKYETPGILAFKTKNQIMYTPKCSGSRTFNFNANNAVRRISLGKATRDKEAPSNTVRKSTIPFTPRRHSQFIGFQVPGKKNLTIQKYIDMKQSNNSSEGAFTKQIKANIQLINESNSNKASQIENPPKADCETRSRTMKTQSVILKCPIPHFPAKVPEKTHSSKSSKVGKPKLCQIDFGLVQQNTFQESTVQSHTGFYTPSTRPRKPIAPNYIETRVGLLFSQQIKHRTSFDQSLINLNSNVGPAGLFPKVKNLKESEIIAEDNEDNCDIYDNGSDMRKITNSRMSQSITMDQPMLQRRFNEKPLNLLDMFVSKLTVEIVDGEIVSNSIINNLAVSVIQPSIQERTAM